MVFTYTSLYKELSTCKGSFKDSERHARACRGSFLFLDLPDLMPNMTRGLPDDVSRDYVLHTAHDVLFLKDVDSCKLGSPKVGGAVSYNSCCFVFLRTCVHMSVLTRGVISVFQSYTQCTSSHIMRMAPPRP